jgi:hypothetical protein
VAGDDFFRNTLTSHIGISASLGINYKVIAIHKEMIMVRELPIGLIASLFSDLWVERTDIEAAIREASKTVENWKLGVAAFLLAMLCVWAYQENMVWLTILVFFLGYVFIAGPWSDAYFYSRYKKSELARVNGRLWDLELHWYFAGGWDSQIKELRIICDDQYGIDIESDEFGDWASRVRKEMCID